jgi:hypothetical protein
MGIVKISDRMHTNLRVASGALSRSINAQAEHWMRVGMLAELNPDLRYGEICQMLVRAEHEGGAHPLSGWGAPPPTSTPISFKSK